MFFDEEICEELEEDYLRVCTECELMTESKSKTNIFRKIYRSILRVFYGRQNYAETL